MESASSKKGLRGSDRMLYALLKDYLERGNTINEAIQVFVVDVFSGSNQVARNNRSKFKQKLNELHRIIQAEKND